jgi:DNA-binding transcriptional MocR family regulator
MIGYQKTWKVVHEYRKPNPKPRYHEISEKHRFKGFIELEEEKLKEKKLYEERLKRGISLDSDYQMYQSSHEKTTVRISVSRPRLEKDEGCKVF